MASLRELLTGTKQQHQGDETSAQARVLETFWQHDVKSTVAAEANPVGGTITIMAAAPTTTVEIDSNLLERLRQRRPAKSDRELLESVARIQLGREASDRAAERFQGVSSEAIEREAVKAVREVRRERADRRRAAG